MNPKDALNSSLFKNPKVMRSWNSFCEKKIEDRYNKILKMANIN
jgi:hypothetical protein